MKHKQNHTRGIIKKKTKTKKYDVNELDEIIGLNKLDHMETLLYDTYIYWQVLHYMNLRNVLTNFCSCVGLLYGMIYSLSHAVLTKINVCNQTTTLLLYRYSPIVLPAV